MNKKFVCKRPFNSLVFGTHGISSCYCYYGPTIDVNELKLDIDYFEHSKLSKLRELIKAGDYSQCNKDCLIFKKADDFAEDGKQRMFYDYDGPVDEYNDNEHLVTEVTMALEDGCNLNCPSCRENIKNNSLDNSIIQEGWKYLRSKLSTLEIVSLGGSGEPFTHREVISFLKNTDFRSAPNLKTVSIITNGTLFNQKLWSQINPYLHDKLEILVSFDGASKYTYELNRRGARFEIIMDNLLFLSKLELKKLTLLVVLQKNNYKEIKDFISISKDLNSYLNFYALRNWGTYSHKDFDSRNIFNPKHVDHTKFRAIQTDIINEPKIKFEF